MLTQNQIAQKLGIQTYMVVAWEKKFNIEPSFENGEKIYSDKDLATFKSVKELLYEKGLSMDAAKKYLYNSEDLEGTTLQAASTLLFTPAKPSKQVDLMVSSDTEKQLALNLLTLKERLVKLRNVLDS